MGDKLNRTSNTTINLRVDVDETEVSFDKIKNTWHCQNFTELLNRPKVINFVNIFY